ncbi:hypothetical protein WKH56_20565 [Priestia sp. SB1]|uniref:hypothetical protein n=1 Tax=Priestia sp. SB1 TaxID=3132359 RepID=UPI00317F794D
MDQLKKDLEVKTTEELFLIPEPSEHQCSRIDKLVKKSRSIEKSSKFIAFDYNENELESLQEGFTEACNTLHDIQYEISDFEDELEAFRKAIEEAREWGEAWKKLCKRIIEENKDNINLEKYL